MCELVFIGFLFGLDKLEILMTLRTGEKMPKFVKFFFKVFIPVFIFIIYVIGWIDEFQYKESRDKNSWNDGILWAARLLFIVPMLLIPVGMWKQYPCEDIYELIEEQYGIRFEDKVNPDDLGYRITNQKMADDNFGNPKKAAEEPAKVNNE